MASYDGLTLQQRLYRVQEPYTYMKLNGARLDIPYIEAQLTVVRYEIEQETELMRSLTGNASFNPNSPPQVGKVLYHGTPYKFRVTEWTETGAPSTNVNVLNTLLEEDPTHPFLNSLIRQRKANKFAGTYFEGFLLRADPDGFIHPNFNTFGTVTGRPSSSDPNFLNIPSRGKKAKQVKRMVVARKGRVILQVDVAQAELRGMAHYANDPAMIQMFIDDVDLHRETALFIWGEDRVKEMRPYAKNGNFNIGYMGSPETLTNLIWDKYEQEERLKLIQEAGGKDKAYKHLLSIMTEFYVKWIQRHYRVPEYWKEVAATAFRQGYLETAFGRKRRVPIIPDPDRDPGGYEELKRHLVNFTIQSPCVDITQEALYRMHRYIQDRNLPATIINCVYDSIWFDCEPSVMEELASVTVAHLQSIPAEYGIDRVPFKADCEYGVNAADTETLKL